MGRQALRRCLKGVSLPKGLKSHPVLSMALAGTRVALSGVSADDKAWLSRTVPLLVGHVGSPRPPRALPVPAGLTPFPLFLQGGVYEGSLIRGVTHLVTPSVGYAQGCCLHASLWLVGLFVLLLVIRCARPPCRSSYCRRSPSRKYWTALKYNMKVMSLEWVREAERLGCERDLSPDAPELVRSQTKSQTTQTLTAHD